jgi:hypothetical protein
MPPTTGTRRLLSALRSIWRGAVDGLIALGAYYGAVPPAHLAALIGGAARERRRRRSPRRTAARSTSHHRPPDTLLTEAERRAWERLVERY